MKNQCKTCGRSFHTKGVKLGTYCSNACRQKAYRNRRNVYYRAMQKKLRVAEQNKLRRPPRKV